MGRLVIPRSNTAFFVATSVPPGAAFLLNAVPWNRWSAGLLSAAWEGRPRGRSTPAGGPKRPSGYAPVAGTVAHQEPESLPRSSAGRPVFPIGGGRPPAGEGK